MRYMHASFFLFCIPAFRLCIIQRPRLVFFFFVERNDSSFLLNLYELVTHRVQTDNGTIWHDGQVD